MVKFAGLTKEIPASGAAASEPLERRLYVFSGKDGKSKAGALLQIADTMQKKTKGLSGRDSLEPFGGMVFPGSRYFWMKDTNFPLDLVFSDKNGAIVDILGMDVDKEGSKTYGSSKPEAKVAYELPRGFCEKHGIGIGDTVSKKELRGTKKEKNHD